MLAVEIKGVIRLNMQYLVNNLSCGHNRVISQTPILIAELVERHG